MSKKAKDKENSFIDKWGWMIEQECTLRSHPHYMTRVEIAKHFEEKSFPLYAKYRSYLEAHIEFTLLNVWMDDEVKDGVLSELQTSLNQTKPLI